MKKTERELAAKKKMLIELELVINSYYQACDPQSLLQILVEQRLRLQGR